jgi:N-acetylneuraminic acid mutarotase
MRVLVFASLLLLQSAAGGFGTWTTAPSIPERIQEHHGVLYRGRIYIAGGIDSTGRTTPVVYRFDPRTERWTKLADLPEPRHHMPLVVLNDTLYGIGGFDDLRFTPKATVWIYREDKNAWESRASLAVPRGASAAGVVDGKIVVVGGYGTQRALLDTTLAYDPRRDSWSNRAPMPTKRDHLEAQVVNGMLYAIGGRPISPANNYNTVEAYDLAADKWTMKAPMPSRRGGLASAVLDGKIHTFGGERTDGVFDNHEVYDPARDAWSVETAMPTARHGLAAVTFGGRIYVIGGGPKQGLAQTAAVEVWTP